MKTIQVNFKRVKFLCSGQLPCCLVFVKLARPFRPDGLGHMLCISTYLSYISRPSEVTQNVVIEHLVELMIENEVVGSVRHREPMLR